MRFVHYKYGLIAVLLLMVMPAWAQREARQLVRHGNRLYKDSLYTKAEVDYRKAIEQSPAFALARYNLAASLMRENKLEEGLKEMEMAAKGLDTPSRKAKAFHNVGVILQASEKYAEAIEAYKEALRNNPEDDGTRYNLALCQYMLKNNPQQDQQNQDQQNEGQDKTNEEKKDSEKENQSESDSSQDQKQDEKPAQENESQNNMSKENAEQLLKAAMQDEKDVQDRMNKQQKSAQKRRLEKQW